MWVRFPPSAYKKQLMQNLQDQDPGEKERKGFKVGLATLAAVFLILLVVVIFFVKGCDKGKKEELEAQKITPQEETAQEAEIAPQPAPVGEGEVAGEEMSEEAATQEGKTYTVKSGDTLYEIGLKFGVDWEEIAKVNGIDNQAALKVGDEIIIPSE